MLIKSLITLVIVLSSMNVMAIEKDKKKHFGFSTVIGAGSTLIFEDYKYSLAACMGVGIAKETYDYYDYGKFDGKDLMYDAIGCGLGVFTGEMIKFTFSEKEAGVSINYKF